MPSIVLYGNSLVVSSLGASLQRQADLRVFPFDASQPDADRQLAALQPDVILFDLASIRSDLQLSLWQAHSRSRLIGVDLARDEMLVLSGQSAGRITLKHLLDVVNLPAKSSHLPSQKEITVHKKEEVGLSEMGN